MYRLPNLFSAIPVLSLAVLGACSKIELPTEGGEDKEESPSISVIEDSDVLTVAQAIGLPEEMEGYDIAVKGYVVGYVNGSSFSEKTACFSLPSEKANTNMLLADRKDETDYRKCFPVMLSVATASSDFRGELNLYDHPDLFRRIAVVEGQLSTYFRVWGIKKIWDYYFLEEEPNTGEDESDAGEDKPDSGEDESDDRPVAPPVDPPVLDDTGQVVPEGR